MLDVKNGQMLAETTVPYASDLLCKDGRWFILHGNGILCWDPDTGEKESIVYEENGGGTIMSSVSSDKSTAAWSGAPFGSAVYVVDTEKGDVCTSPRALSMSTHIPTHSYFRIHRVCVNSCRV